MSYYMVSSLAVSLCTSIYVASNTHENRTPPYYSQIDAGNILTSSCWDSVDEIEKLKDYSFALKLLILLVNCPYSEHRRGRYYIRMLIDLKRVDILADFEVLLSFTICKTARLDKTLKVA